MLLPNQSKRQLNLKIKIGALNILQYPDRLSTPAGGTQAQGRAISNTNPTVNSSNPVEPSRIKSYGNGYMLPPNPSIDAPFNTFIYGGLTQQTGLDLLSPPSDSQNMFFPFAKNYGYGLNTPLSQNTFNFPSTKSTSNTNSSPFIPSRSQSTISDVPLLTTYNFWSFVDSNNQFINTNINYQRGANPVYGDQWTNGKITQVLDTYNQVSLNINTLNNQPVSIRRMFGINQDTLYETQSTLVYPSSANISPVKYNIRDGKTIINPNENCGFMIYFNVNQISSSVSQNSNSQAIKIKFGNLDFYKANSINSNYIEYYELIIDVNNIPTLRFWHPYKQAFNDIALVGPQMSTGFYKVYVHFAGNNLLIGFDEDTYNWNSIGSIEPNENEKFELLCHLTPGGKNDPQQNSNIQVEINNINCNFKYSAIAFQNLINSAPDTLENFFDSSTDKYKKQFAHNTSVSTKFLKLISQTTRLSDYFNAKSLRLKERINNTPENTKKKKTIYAFNSEIMLSNTARDFASISFARDWRLADPFSENYNNSNCWEIKPKILNPNYSTLAELDANNPSNISTAVVFDSPVYSPVFIAMNTLNMPTADLVVNSNNQIVSTISVDALDTTQINIDLLNPDSSPSSSYQQALIDPVFYFKWGDITDLVSSQQISITHTANNISGIATATANLQLDNLHMSTRGTNILNYMENNLTVIQISAGYGDPFSSTYPVYFEGVATNITTSRGPITSTCSVSCTDWLSYTLTTTPAQSSLSLQGVSMRDRIDTGLRLASMENFSAFLSSYGDILPYSTSQANPLLSFLTDGDNSLILALNFRQGNASSSSQGNTLSATVEVNDYCAKVIQETLQFIVDDLAIPILYQNLRKTSSGNYETIPIDSSSIPASNINAAGRRMAVVIENRFLQENLSTNGTYRVKDAFKFLTSPIAFTNSGDLFGDLTSSLQNENIEDYHGVIVTPLNTASNPSGLYEGVYLFGQTLSSFPIYHVRSSDSYQTSATSTDTTDAFLYATALNRVFNQYNENLLDIINEVDFNSESNLVLSNLTSTNKQAFSYGYVGFRKRYVDDQSSNTAIQTVDDLQKRGDLWAQYIRKVVQNLSFTAIVTKPLQHYNNFWIQGMVSPNASNATGSVYNQYFDTSEFKNFLYETVTYTIQKESNIITALVRGSITPRVFNPNF